MSWFTILGNLIIMTKNSQSNGIFLTFLSGDPAAYYSSFDGRAFVKLDGLKSGEAIFCCFKNTSLYCWLSESFCSHFFFSFLHECPSRRMVARYGSFQSYVDDTEI